MVWIHVFHIILAGFLGLIMGFLDRRKISRTFAIIAMGSCLVAVISTEFFRAAAPWAPDPGRLSAQVVAAMGFIGTGLIWISDKGRVRGLAGAASLWVTAIMGMLIGSGLQHISTLAVFMVLLLYWITNLLAKRRINKNSH